MHVINYSLIPTARNLVDSPLSLITVTYKSKSWPLTKVATHHQPHLFLKIIIKIEKEKTKTVANNSNYLT